MKLLRSRNPMRHETQDASPTHEDDRLVSLIEDTLTGCGFAKDDLRVELALTESAQPPLTALVQIRSENSLLWNFAEHLQAYVLDRVLRHSGIRLRRLIVTPMCRPEIELDVALAGMRLLFASQRLQNETRDSRVQVDFNITYPTRSGRALVSRPFDGEPPQPTQTRE
jgi:hypothetical protein